MEWENPSPPLPPPLRHQHHRQSEDHNDGGGGGGGGWVDVGAMCVKVMTDEQVEILRTQIAVYATICDQLVQLHNSFTAQQDLSGVRLGNLYCDPLLTGGHKTTARQRWSPTPVQLQILESIFEQGTGTPSKQKIKNITAQLSEHGKISETNVYNWFQNRRARSKRKQQTAGTNNAAESEVETDVESPMEKSKNPENLQPFQPLHSSPRAPDVSSNNIEPLFSSRDMSRPSESLDQLSFYESILQNPGVEMPGSYNPYQQPDDYGTTG